MFALLFAFAVQSAFAQTSENKNENKEKQVNVPMVVKENFAKEYPGKKAKWGAEDGGYEAEFKINGTDASAVYTPSGHRKSFEAAIKLTEVPAVALEYVKKNYPTHKITESAKITDDKNTITYEIEVGKDGKSWDVIFDATGKFIKQELGD